MSRGGLSTANNAAVSASSKAHNSAAVPTCALSCPIRRALKTDCSATVYGVQPCLMFPVVNGCCTIYGGGPVTGEKALYLGGYSPTYGCGTNNVAEYEFRTHTWNCSRDLPAFNHPISEATMDYVPEAGAVYVFGGWDDLTVRGGLWQLKPRVNPENGVLECVGCRWRLITDSVTPAPGAAYGSSSPSSPSPCARRGHSSAVGNISGRVVIFIFGGFNGHRRLNDLWAFDVLGEKWIEMRVDTTTTTSNNGVSPSPRDNAALAFDPLRRRLLLFGGYCGTAPRNDLYAMSIGDSLALNKGETTSLIIAPPASNTTGGNGVRKDSGKRRVSSSLAPPGSAAPKPKTPLASGPSATSSRPSGSPPVSPISAGPVVEVVEVVEEIDPATVYHWSLIGGDSSPPPLPRYGCFAAVVGQYFVIGFGQDATGPSRQCFQMNLMNLHWSVFNFENTGAGITGGTTLGSATATGTAGANIGTQNNDQSDLAEARCYGAVAFSFDYKTGIIVSGVNSVGKYHTSVLELEMERTEPVVQKTGKK